MAIGVIDSNFLFCWLSKLTTICNQAFLSCKMQTSDSQTWGLTPSFQKSFPQPCLCIPRAARLAKNSFPGTQVCMVSTCWLPSPRFLYSCHYRSSLNEGTLPFLLTATVPAVLSGINKWGGIFYNSNVYANGDEENFFFLNLLILPTKLGTSWLQKSFYNHPHMQVVSIMLDEG